MNLTTHQITSFQNVVLDFYRTAGRTLPWRNHKNPYAVLVAEIMLQQTQAARVIQKFPEFLNTFPNWNALATAPLESILRVWQGMGYNRRAKAIREIAQCVVDNHAGELPADPAILQTLPGIGPHTAASVCAFAFNMPTVFIETNIRTVFIHHFFKQQTNIHDRQIAPLVKTTLYTPSPRDWYNALMDYGTHIKATTENPNRKSAHHTTQSRFEGSNRQLRGRILKNLTHKPATKRALCKHLNIEHERLNTIIAQLIAEGMIEQTKKTIHIARSR